MKLQNMQAMPTHSGMIEANRCRECGNKSWYNYPESLKCVRCGDVKQKTDEKKPEPIPAKRKGK